MAKRKVVRFFAACLLGVSLSGIAYARSGHSGGGGFHGSSGFHHFGGAPGFHHFGGPHFHRHAFIGGGVIFAPSFFYPPPLAYYDPPPAVQYVEPPPANSTPGTGSWYYCQDSNQYYPYVQQCPGGWQPVAPQPPPS